MVGVVARGGAAHAVAESAHPETDTQKLVAWDVSPPLAPHRARGRVRSAPVSGPRTGQGRERGIGSWQRRWRGREQVGLSETAALRQVLTWHAFGRVSAAFQRPWARAARARRTGWPCVVLYNSFSNTVLPRGRAHRLHLCAHGPQGQLSAPRPSPLPSPTSAASSATLRRWRPAANSKSRALAGVISGSRTARCAAARSRPPLASCSISPRLTTTEPSARPPSTSGASSHSPRPAAPASRRCRPAAGG